jgi:hypothetical protein
MTWFANIKLLPLRFVGEIGRRAMRVLSAVQQLGLGGPVSEQRPLAGGLGRFKFSRGPIGAIRAPGVMPSREVAPIPGGRKPTPPPRAYAGPQLKSAATIAVVNTSRIVFSIRAS